MPSAPWCLPDLCSRLDLDRERVWPGNEHSELLHIPLRWLRAVWIASALLITALFLVRALRQDEPA